MTATQPLSDADAQRNFRQSLPIALRTEFDQWVEARNMEAGETEERANGLQDEFEGQVEQLTACLEHVKYWMLDTLVHHRPMTDPRAVLRRIEECLR